MTRRTRIAVTVAALAVLQLGALLVYWSVQRSRGETTSTPATFAAETFPRPEAAPTFTVANSDGASRVVGGPAANVRIVHFWGTWCDPCRDELPALLAFGRSVRERGIEVVAVAVDDRWEDIQSFFAGRVPAEVVVSSDPTAHKRFGVSTLPDSYLVDRAGRLVERFHGARDWSTSAAREHVLRSVAALGAN